MDALADWVREQGGTVHLETRDEPGEGRGAVATRDIEHGARILSVPHAVLLTPEIVDESPTGLALAAAGVPLVDRQFMLAAYLLVSRREQTPWTRYAEALPETAPNVPATYDDADLAYLEGSSILVRIQRERRIFRRQHEAIVATLPLLATCAFDEFRWARTLVPSRAFAVLGTEALVPMADMLNHRPVPDVEWGYEHPTESFVMRALRPIAAGEFLHDSYGKKSNALLLELYGFCLDDPDRDEGVLRFPVIHPEHPLAPGTNAFGYNVGGERAFRVAAAKARAEETAAITYLRRLLGDAVPVMAEDRRVSEMVVQACDRALAAFPTTLQEDDAMLAGAVTPLSERVRDCVRVRAGEKRALLAVRERYANANQALVS